MKPILSNFCGTRHTEGLRCTKLSDETVEREILKCKSGLVELRSMGGLAQNKETRMLNPSGRVCEQDTY